MENIISRYCISLARNMGRMLLCDIRNHDVSDAVDILYHGNFAGLQKREENAYMIIPRYKELSSVLWKCIYRELVGYTFVYQTAILTGV